MNAENFISQLLTELPELKEYILDDDNLGLTALQIMTFMAFTQKAIDNNDLAMVKRCFNFVDSVFNNVSAGINNSLNISYLGKLNFKDNDGVLNLLPTKLSKAIIELKKAYAADSKNEKLGRFINNLNKGQS